MNAFFKWEYVFDYIPKLLAALPVTLQLVAVATITGTIIGLLIAIARIERIPVLRQLGVLFVSFVRCTPELVQLFLVYYGIPFLLGEWFSINTTNWEKIIFVYITFGLNAAGFFSEMFRGAIESIPKNQFDAGLSIGMTRFQIYRRIILPQTVRIILPNYGTMLVGLLQSTAIAFTLGIVDVIGKAQLLAALTYHLLEGYFVAAVIFVILSFVIDIIFRYIDKKLDFKNSKTKVITQESN